MKLVKVDKSGLCGLGDNIHKITTDGGEHVCYVAIDRGKLFLNFHSKVGFDQVRDVVSLIDQNRTKLV
jgi:hypothetical protein